MGDYTDPGDEQPGEPGEVELQRITALRALGFAVEDAQEIARLDVDLVEMRTLLGRGCPHQLARRILLPV